MTSHLEGRHVVVTGAGTGIGRAIALRLATEGAKLSLFARDAERLRQTAREAKGSTYVGAADIRSREEVERAFAAAAEVHGPIYALVANSGIGGPNQDGEGDRFDDLIATNLNGTYHCARAALRHLAKGPEARHLVLMSSILGRIGVAGYTGYCASKTGVIGMARAFAAELAPENVQVNAICPGWVDTEMAWVGLRALGDAMGVSVEKAHEVAMSHVPLGRMSKPEHIAGLITWLIGPDAVGVTGQALDMNNGAFMI